MSRTLFSAVGLLALLSGCGTDWAGKDPTDQDADGDGFSPSQGDCWDAPGDIIIDGQAVPLTGADVHPGAEDAPYDGFDADCAGDDDFDADGDGFVPARFLSATILNNPGFDIGARPQDTDCADVDDDYDDTALHQTVPGADRPDPAAVFPGAAEDAFYDGIDGDCAGGSDFDQDGDGHDSADAVQADGSVGGDCDDLAAEINPEAVEVCDDVDNDCDAAIDGDDPDFDPSTLRAYYVDGDGDGYGDPATEELSCSPIADRIETADDCDDTNSAINPAADEICDEGDVDEDCDGLADDLDSSTLTDGMATSYGDLDGDGYGDPGNALSSCDPIDGYVANSDDCDDGAAAVNPAATEICDELDVDEDCSGAADDADAGVDPGGFSTFFADTDGDGFGDAGATVDQCDPGGGYIVDNTDCDDSAAAINPGATEVCDAADVDENCNGSADDADATLDTTTQTFYYTDGDGDGYGDVGATGAGHCEGDEPAGVVVDNTDCDDTSAAVNPGATEVCDAADTDEDCDGDIDDADASLDLSTQLTYYTDGDGDGYGDVGATGAGHCEGDQPSGMVIDNTDCDDATASVNPGATEICDALDVDEDCSGAADDDDAGVDTSTQTRFYPDGDGDGFGNLYSSGTLRCDAASAEVTDNTDCNDVLAAVNPGATEVCDAADLDEDCSGTADDDDPGVDTTTQTTFYVDADGDGYGDPATTTLACDEGDGAVSDNTDCEDGLASAYPGAGETCNDGVDSDCDGDGQTETIGAVTTDVCVLESGILEDEALRSYTAGLNAFGLGEAFAAGDLDGSADGVVELVVGAPGTSTFSVDDLGSVFVVPTLSGESLPDGDTVSLSTVTATRVRGSTENEWLGAAVGVGDVDNDGFDDLVVGAPGTNRNGSGANPKGSLYVVAGPITGTANLVAASAADYSGTGSTNGSFLGADLIVGGDADGDGIDGDILLGNPACGDAFYGTESSAGGGKVYLLPAGASPVPATISHSGSGTITEYWIGTTCGGWALGMGDFSATGVDTVFMSEPEVGGVPFGRVYIDDAANGNTLLTQADYIWGPATGSFFGDAIAVADLDNDGYDDLLASATFDGAGTGAVYRLDGDSTWASTDYIHQVADASITAAAANTRFGASIAVAGDIDDDGNLDLLIGEPDGASGGGAWLVYGPFSGAITVSSANAEQWTSTEASAGRAVIGGLDLDGDGYDSFLVGAPDTDATTGDEGAAYLFSGLGL